MSSLCYKLNNVRPDLAAHLEKSVESVPHVQAVTFDAQNARLVVEHDGAREEDVVAALREEGFAPEPA